MPVSPTTHRKRQHRGRIHKRTTLKAQTTKRSLYGSQWRREREKFLRLHPVCNATGCSKPANEVDHIIPHKGDLKLFWDRANWQALCKSCHSSKTATEDGGFGRQASIRPKWLKPSLIPVTIISGPPGSGKTTYVEKHRGPNDLTLDLDEIAARLSGLPWYQSGPEWLDKAIRERNKLLGGLNRDRKHDRAWLIVSEPKQAHRAWWREVLKAERVVVLATAPDVCLTRIDSDHRRLGSGKDYEHIVKRWWARFSDGHDEEVIRW